MIYQPVRQPKPTTTCTSSQSRSIPAQIDYQQIPLFQPPTPISLDNVSPGEQIMSRHSLTTSLTGTSRIPRPLVKLPDSVSDNSPCSVPVLCADGTRHQQRFIDMSGVVFAVDGNQDIFDPSLGVPVTDVVAHRDTRYDIGQTGWP